MLAVVAGIFLAFVAGAFVADFKVFPYPQLFEDAFTYLHATEERQQTEDDATVESETAAPTGKVTVAAKPESFLGYTFLTFDTGRPSTARLIDMDGNVLHEWHRGFLDIWPDHPQRTKPSPESAMAWRYGILFPNGDIIVTVKAMGDTPDGYGLAKLDKDSNVIWAVPSNFNHHVSIADDGRVFGMVHEWRDTKAKPVDGADFLPKRVLEDFVVELSPDGKELSRSSLLEALATPEYRELLGSSYFKFYSTKTWDPMHPNDVEYINEEFASHHSFMKPGMLLISLRDLDALIVYDPKAKKVVWANRGPWQRQHDPDLLPGGNILLFDNRGDNIKGGGSRILEFIPETLQMVWTYSGTSDKPFESDKSGGEQRLPNGNTLVSEDDGGRLFEVTKDDKIVWEYKDVRLHHAMRVTKDWVQFPLKPTPNAVASSGK